MTFTDFDFKVTDVTYTVRSLYKFLLITLKKHVLTSTFCVIKTSLVFLKLKKWQVTVRAYMHHQSHSQHVKHGYLFLFKSA